MSLLFGLDPAGLPDRVVDEFNNLNAALQTAFNRLGSWGKWIDMPYVSSNFFATTGTWTVSGGHMLAYRYTAQAGILQVNIHIVGSTTGAGMGNQLFIRLPPQYGILTNVGFCGIARWNAGAGVPPGLVGGGIATIPNALQLIRDVASPSTNWPSSTDLNISISATVPVYLL